MTSESVPEVTEKVEDYSKVWHYDGPSPTTYDVVFGDLIMKYPPGSLDVSISTMISYMMNRNEYSYPEPSYMDGGVIKISSGDISMEIPKGAGWMSIMIDSALMDSEESYIEFPLDGVSENILRKIAEYMNYYAWTGDISTTNYPTKIDSVPSSHLEILTSKWEYEFINSMTFHEIVELTRTVSQLMIEPLRKLCIAYFATFLKGKDLNELRESFRMPDFEMTEDQKSHYERILDS